MTHIETTALPGVGRLYIMNTLAGRSVGVIQHRGDRRELIIYDTDPDSVGVSLCLTRDEADGLAGMLGAGVVANHIARLEQGSHNVVTLQVLIGPNATAPTVASAVRRSHSDAAIAAVVRGERVHTVPPPDFRLEPDDLVVVVGTMPGALAVLEAITSD